MPAELENIVLKTIAKTPAERYDTAQDLADDLERFLANKPIHAKRPTLIQTVTRWAQRHRTVVAAGVLAMTASLVVLAISNIRIARAHSRALQQKERTEKQFRMANSSSLGSSVQEHS